VLPGLELHFENHNAEPEHAEIHYIPHTVAETRRFFSDAVRERLAHPDDSIRDVLNGFISLARAGAYRATSSPSKKAS